MYETRKRKQFKQDQWTFKKEGKRETETFKMVGGPGPISKEYCSGAK